MRSVGTWLMISLLLSGCTGGADLDAADAGPPAEAADEPRPEAPEGAEVDVRGGGYVWTQRSEGEAPYGENMVFGYYTSIGRGITIAQVHVPDNATAIQFELRHTATLDAEPYVLAPRQPCGGDEPVEPQLVGLTGYVRDEEGMYRDQDEGDAGFIRLDADVLAAHACGRPCPAPDEPSYDETCQTWVLGFRVVPASGPFAWEAGVSVAVGTALDEGHRVLEG